MYEQYNIFEKVIAMDKIIEIKSIDKMEKGSYKSKPVLITAENDKQYYLRMTKENESQPIIKQEAAAPLQEYISYRLAKKLGILVPHYAIIDINKDFIFENRNKLKEENLSEGKYFGSERIKNVMLEPDISPSSPKYNYLVEKYNKTKEKSILETIWQLKEEEWESFLSEFDPQIFADLIAFNIFICNKDFFRNPKNLLFSTNSNVYCIDFVLSYGNSNLPCTEHEELTPNNLKVSKKTLLQCYTQNVNSFIIDNLHNNIYTNKPTLGEFFEILVSKLSFDPNPFKKMVSKIEGLSDKKIKEIIYGAPQEWFSKNLEDEQKSFYYEFLLKNRCNVKKTINLMVGKRLIKNAPVNKNISVLNAHNCEEEQYGSLLKW
ncbi:MAG: HipA family kinase [Lactobacillus panisapium]